MEISSGNEQAETAMPMKLTNDSYVILMGTKNFTERYYRDQDGWLKISARGREFRMTAEQVLNHLLPAVAGVKPNLFVRVEHRELAKSAASRKPRTRAKKAGMSHSAIVRTATARKS